MTTIINKSWGVGFDYKENCYTVSKGWKVIASVKNNNDAKQADNAKLMAAASEMAYTLQQVHLFLTNMENKNEYAFEFEYEINIMEQALKKAGINPIK